MTFERHRFLVRDQDQGETIDRYVTALPTLAATCEFGELPESLIRDRFVCGLSNTVVKERLLRTSGLKLQTDLDTCRAAELAKEQVKAIESHSEKMVAAVRVPRHHPVSRSSGSSAGRCSRCGYVHGSKPCPANGKPCHICKGLGHFASMCMTKLKSNVQNLHSIAGVQVPDERETTSGLEMPSDKFSTEEKTLSSVPSFFVGNVAGAGSSWQRPIMINGVEISFKLDTGAQVNIIPYSDLSKMTPRRQLHRVATRFLLMVRRPLVSGGKMCV